MIGVLVALAPFALIVASFASRWAPRFPKLGAGLAIAALSIATFNAYLSFVRPALRAREPAYRYVSPNPLVANILLVAALLAAFGSPLVAALALAAYMLDTGGIQWFVIATWRDESMWR